MTMNKPAIDELLHEIPSYYELTVASALRAQDIKRANREHLQPLQTALEEVAAGKVEVVYAVDEPEQTELALTGEVADVTKQLLNPTEFNPPAATPPPAGTE